MTDVGAADPDTLAAGDFIEWLVAIRAALRGEGAADVPCGGCTACCTSHQFVHIAPDERATLARIPSGLLFAAPGLPAGHMLLGYDERGHCPMLVDGACSIYPDRPRTCRVYDCRVFPAAGIENEDPGRESIRRQAARWRFADAGDEARALACAVRAAAEYVERHRHELEDAPVNATEHAVLAVELHDLFLAADRSEGAPPPEPALETVQGEIARRRARPD